MSRHENRSTPKIVSKYLYTDDAFTGTLVGSPAWFTWLSTATTFFFESPAGTFTAHLERRQRGGLYWIAYRRLNRRLTRSHLGKSDQLTFDRLLQAAIQLSSPPRQ
jgi:hypothetical protein